VRRLWLFVLVLVAAAAVWGAHLPVIAGHDDELCGVVEPAQSLASLGMSLPSIAILVVAVLELVASFASAPSVLPRATVGRNGVVGDRFAGWARGLVDSTFMVAMRPLVWVLAVMMFFVALFVVGQQGDGAELCALWHLVLAFVLAFRPRRPVRAE
jgi:hypothetical protein